MVRHLTGLVLIAGLVPAVSAQQVSASPNQTVEVTNRPSSSKPTLPTSPPDAAVPDPGSIPAPASGKKSAGKRALEEITPRCLDALVHTCWSQPPGKTPAQASAAEREFAKNMEVANFYFREKNYTGADSRFREALQSVPNSPEATYRRAQCLEKLHRTSEAREMYQSYLRLQASGPFSKDAEKALQRLSAPGR